MLWDMLPCRIAQQRGCVSCHVAYCWSLLQQGSLPHLLSCPFLPMQEARAAQAAAEKQAAEAAKAGAARRLKEAEARAETLEGSLAELRGELERQVGAPAGLSIHLAYCLTAMRQCHPLVTSPLLLNAPDRMVLKAPEPACLPNATRSARRQTSGRRFCLARSLACRCASGGPCCRPLCLSG